MLLLFFEETTDVVAGIQARAAGATSPNINMKSFVMPIDYFKGKEFMFFDFPSLASLSIFDFEGELVRTDVLIFLECRSNKYQTMSVYGASCPVKPD